MTSLSSLDLLSAASVLPPLSTLQDELATVPALALREQLWLEQQLHRLRSQLDAQSLRLPFEAAAGCNPLVSLLPTLVQMLQQYLPEAEWFGVIWQGDEAGSGKGRWKRACTGVEVQEIFLDELQDWQRSHQAWPLLESDQCLAWLVGTEVGLPKQGLIKSVLVERSIQQLMAVLRQVKPLQQSHEELQGLRSRNQSLARTSQLKSEFLANTSHEIRTPLSSILGFTHLLREQGYNPGSQRHQEYLRIILTSGQHLLALINDILDLSKIEANQMDLQGELIKVEPLCKMAMVLVQEKANDKGLQLNLEIDPTVDSLFADPLRLKQMLFNLLSNALKFTRQGSVGLQVALTAEAMRFTVWDTGVGIPPEQQLLLFKPYQQLAVTAAQHSEGTGLGLALTRKLAELHGGRMEVASEVDRGSRFTVVLPLQPMVALSPVPEVPLRDVQSAVETMVPTKALRGKGDGITGSKRVKRPRKAIRSYHVLLVEDNVHNAHLIIAYLCKLGYEVTWTKSGEEMWQSLSHSLPAMILMDVNLPETGGLTLVKQLRETERYASLPVIVQTAMAMTGDRETCLEAGANDYVAKPIDLQKLADTLAKYSDPGLR